MNGLRPRAALVAFVGMWTACDRAKDPGVAPATAAVVESVRIPVAPTVTLAGVLEHPRRSSAPAEGMPAARQHRRAPVVLFLSGSGPQDRDGGRDDLAGYRPFVELAADARSLGYATLRLDERGTGASSGTFTGTTTHGFADDIAAALAWLRARSDVDGTHAVLVGHSEGALVALLVARRDTNVRALVLLGAAARTGRSLAQWQRHALVVANASLYPREEQTALLARADREAEAAAARDPWLAAWFALDPLAVASRVRIPVLLLHGANDRQVPPSDASRLADALREGAGARDGVGSARDGRAADVTVRILPRANHLLLEDDSGAPDAYARLASRHLMPAARTAIRAWLGTHRPDVRLD